MCHFTIFFGKQFQRVFALKSMLATAPTPTMQQHTSNFHLKWKMYDTAEMPTWQRIKLNITLTSDPRRMSFACSPRESTTLHARRLDPWIPLSVPQRNLRLQNNFSIVSTQHKHVFSHTQIFTHTKLVYWLHRIMTMTCSNNFTHTRSYTARWNNLREILNLPTWLDFKKFKKFSLFSKVIQSWKF